MVRLVSSVRFRQGAHSVRGGRASGLPCVERGPLVGPAAHADPVYLVGVMGRTWRAQRLAPLVACAQCATSLGQGAGLSPGHGRCPSKLHSQYTPRRRSSVGRALGS